MYDHMQFNYFCIFFFFCNETPISRRNFARPVCPLRPSFAIYDLPVLSSSLVFYERSTPKIHDPIPVKSWPGSGYFHRSFAV